MRPCSLQRLCCLLTVLCSQQRGGDTGGRHWDARGAWCEQQRDFRTITSAELPLICPHWEDALLTALQSHSITLMGSQAPQQPSLPCHTALLTACQHMKEVHNISENNAASVNLIHSLLLHQLFCSIQHGNVVNICSCNTFSM